MRRKLHCLLSFRYDLTQEAFTCAEKPFDYGMKVEVKRVDIDKTIVVNILAHDSADSLIARVPRELQDRGRSDYPNLDFFVLYAMN